MEEQETSTNFITHTLMDILNSIGGKQRRKRSIGTMSLPGRVESPFAILNKKNKMNSTPNISDLLCIQQLHFGGLT